MPSAAVFHAPRKPARSEVEADLARMAGADPDCTTPRNGKSELGLRVLQFRLPNTELIQICPP